VGCVGEPVSAVWPNQQRDIFKCRSLLTCCLILFHVAMSLPTCIIRAVEAWCELLDTDEKSLWAAFARYFIASQVRYA
jgi:hypothetical protein